MAIGRTWEESIQKALRMVDGGGSEGFEPRGDWSDPAKLRHELVKPTDKRIHAIAYALANKVYSVDELHELTSIDRWFLYRLEGISETGADIEHKHRFLSALTRADLLRAKQMGFSDRQIAARLTGQAPPTPGTSRAPHVAKKVSADDVRAARKAVGVTPFVKQARAPESVLCSVIIIATPCTPAYPRRSTRLRQSTLRRPTTCTRHTTAPSTTSTLVTRASWCWARAPTASGRRWSSTGACVCVDPTSPERSAGGF